MEISTPPSLLGGGPQENLTGVGDKPATAMPPPFNGLPSRQPLPSLASSLFPYPGGRNPVDMVLPDLFRRLQTVPEVAASNPSRAQEIAVRAEANRPSPPQDDNGVGYASHLGRRFAAGGIAGAGAVSKGLAVASADVSTSAQGQDEMTLAGMDALDQQWKTPGWSPNAMLKSLSADPRNGLAVSTLNDYWTLLQAGDEQGAKALRAEIEAAVQGRQSNRSMDPASYGAWGLGQSWQDLGDNPDSALYGNPAHRDGLVSQAAYGFGYAVPAIAGTVVAGGLAGPAGAMATGALVGASTGESLDYDKAIAAGATPEEAMEAARWGGLVGVATSLPFTGSGMATALPGFLRQLGGQGGRVVRDAVYNAVKDLPADVAMGVLTTAAENLIVRGVYDSRRGFLDETGEQMESDAVSSAVLSSLFAAFHLRKAFGFPHAVPDGPTPAPHPNPTPGEAMLGELEANSRPHPETGTPTGLPAASVEAEGSLQGGGEATGRPADAGTPGPEPSPQSSPDTSGTDLPSSRKDYISPETRARIEAARKELGVEFNQARIPVPRESMAEQQARTGPGQPAPRPGIPDIQAAAAAARAAEKQRLAADPNKQRRSYTDQVTGLPADSVIRPENYLTREYIENHLKRFEDGAARFQTDWSLKEYGPGQIDGTSFVLSKKDADTIQNACGKDSRCYEELLGVPAGHFGTKPISRVNFDNPREYGLSMARGVEAGANDQWLPGGITDGGVAEAILQGVRKGVGYEQIRITNTKEE